ncbi:hypothetical protein PybrP1_001522 [[Pythium] brassicae (nom. inval.)]|nr:hypothetical protein PybrP1_001522 [[Pythium] brassicae (nom. inval.)]
MGKNGVKVIIRTRPTASFAANQILIDPDENTVTVHASSGLGSPSKSPASSDAAGGAPANNALSVASVAAAAPSNKKDCWKFKYHQVLHNAGQDKVYEAIARDIVHGAHRGVAPRAIAQVYEEVENRIELSYSIRVSYMEIYNDRIYDLLERGGDSAEQAYRGEFVVVEDARGTYVRGLTQVEVLSEQAALDQLFNGELQRTVAEHQLNKRSNRSHCIFTFHLAQKSRAGGNERVVHSKLHLADLAGSERLKKTVDESESKAAAARPQPSSTVKKESMYINQSLSFLEQCIGESKHLEETISTLKLAQRMMRVQNEVATIVETDPAILIRKYEKQVKDLKHELVMHDALVERTGVVYDEHTPEQKHQLLKAIRQFVDASTPEKEDEALRLTSVREIRELFRQFKLLLRNAESDALGRSAASTRAGSAGSTASRSQSSNGPRADIYNPSSTADLAGSAHSDVFVGDDDPAAVGFGLGVVPGAARPSTMDTVKRSQRTKAVSGGGGPGSSTTTGDSGRSRRRSSSPARSVLDASIDERGGRGNDDPSLSAGADGDDDESNRGDSYARRLKSEAFRYYKTGPGKKVQKSVHEEKDKLLDAKHKMKQVSTRLNAVKLEIDKVKAQLEDKRGSRGRGGGALPTPPSRKASATGAGALGRPPPDEVVDEEEFLLMTAEREAKRDYRSLFDDLKEAKSELEFTNRSVELLRMRLMREFEDWYEEEGHASALSKADGSLGRGYDALGGAFGGGHSFAAAFGKDDKLDDGEKFDQMEVDRVRAQDPDSLAFFQAQKKMRQQAGGALTSAAKPTRKPKRG